MANQQNFSPYGQQQGAMMSSAGMSKMQSSEFLTSPVAGIGSQDALPHHMNPS